MPGERCLGPFLLAPPPPPPRTRTGMHVKHAAPPRVHDTRAGRGQGLPRLGQGSRRAPYEKGYRAAKAHRSPPANSRALWTLTRTDVPDTPPDRPGSPVAPRAALGKIPAGAKGEIADGNRQKRGPKNPFFSKRGRGISRTAGPFLSAAAGGFPGRPTEPPPWDGTRLPMRFLGRLGSPCWVKIAATTDRTAHQPGPFLPSVLPQGRQGADGSSQ